MLNQNPPIIMYKPSTFEFCLYTVMALLFLAPFVRSMYRGLFKTKEVVASLDSDASENPLCYLGLCVLKVSGAIVGLLILNQLALPYFEADTRTIVLLYLPTTLFAGAILRLAVYLNKKLRDEDQW